MTPFLLLAGITIGAGVFAATLWSATQIYFQTGPLRRAHSGALAGVILAMLALQFQWQIPSQIAGALLLLAAIWALMREAGWSRLLPLFQILFAIALIRALPFGGNLL